MDRKRLTQEQITDEVNRLKKNGLSDTRTIELVQSDFQYGLVAEEIELYVSKKFQFVQKQMISKALREHGVEIAKAIAREDMDVQSMATAVEYYAQGVPIEMIIQGIEEQHSAYSLRQIYKDVLAEIQETEAEIGEDEIDDDEGIDREFVQQMIFEMKEIALTIQQDSKRYDALSEKLQEISVSKKAEHELAEAKTQLEEVKAELDYTQKRLQKVQDSNMELSKQLEEKQEEVEKLERKLHEKTDEQTKVQMSYVQGYPMYPQGTIGSPQMIYVGNTKSKKNGLANLFGKSDTRRPSKQDITKLVASGQLNTEQLAQVKIAIGRGLTNEQLCDLIQGNVSAEQMKEIIEIAVLENSMR